jgi:predicted nucleic acid-binding protein
MPVWDTSLASRLHPTDRLLEMVVEAAGSDEPILVAPTTVAEISHGLWLKASQQRFLDLFDWFSELIENRVIGLVPFDSDAALLAGHLRALEPVAPSVASGDKRPKPERRVAWVADIQIASTAWVAGEPLVTADRDHFDHISGMIASLYPDHGGLEILGAP